MTLGLDYPAHLGRLTGETVTAALMNAHVRDNLNAIAAVGITGWASYTPTMTGSGSNPTGTTYTGAYAQLGKLVVMRFTATMVTTMGTGTYSWALPVTAETAFGGFAGGIKIIDSGATDYLADLETATTTTVSAYMSYDTKTGAVTQTNPMTVVAGDSYRGSGFYEAA